MASFEGLCFVAVLKLCNDHLEKVTRRSYFNLI